MEARRLAASSTGPAAVTQDWSGCGERKNVSAGNEVWVSSTSMNQSSQPENGPKASRLLNTEARMSSSAPLGSSPARTASLATIASRREKAPYRLGK